MYFVRDPKTRRIVRARRDLLDGMADMKALGCGATLERDDGTDLAIAVEFTLSHLRGHRVDAELDWAVA